MACFFACGEELMSVRYMPASLVSDAAPGSTNIFKLESVIRDRDGLRSIVTYASFVILAMGGKAGPTFGTIGDGYRIARNLGLCNIAACRCRLTRLSATSGMKAVSHAA